MIDNILQKLMLMISLKLKRRFELISDEKFHNNKENTVSDEILYETIPRLPWDLQH
jgi:hypothetical protein